MSRQSTTLLTVSPRTIGPWGDRAWRISGTAQLVEGSLPYWIVTLTDPPNHLVSPPEIGVELPQPDSVLDSVLLLLAVHFGDDEVEANLVETHNISIRNGVREIAPYWELSDETSRILAERLSESVRLGVTKLEELSLVDDTVISRLRAFGFDVDVFELLSSTAN